MQVIPFIGYVEYRKRCVIANNGKCRVRETASNSQGLDMPSNRNNDKRIRESMEKYSSGRYSKLEFLFAVSHCSDIPDTLSEENSDTEEYSWDESVQDDSTNSANSHSSAASACSASIFGFVVVR